jgi:epoxyqueuosine reductase
VCSCGKSNLFYLCAVLNYHHIKKYAAQAGFSLCGVARARVLGEYEPRFSEALGASGAGALGYLVRAPERRFDPATLVSGARTVVVCALAYDSRTVDDPDGRGRVSAHRRDGEYQPRVKAMLSTVLECLRSEDPALGGRACCDTSAILEKAWAVEAGLGWIGRNSLLVNPDYGSFLLLGELVLDAESDRYDEPLVGVGCGSCRRCVENCPVGALVPLGAEISAVDTNRCISALTIEQARKGASVAAIHGWICGCDDCQSVCPHNSRKKVDRFF